MLYFIQRHWKTNKQTLDVVYNESISLDHRKTEDDGLHRASLHQPFKSIRTWQQSMYHSIRTMYNVDISQEGLFLWSMFHGNFYKTVRNLLLRVQLTISRYWFSMSPVVSPVLSYKNEGAWHEYHSVCIYQYIAHKRNTQLNIPWQYPVCFTTVIKCTFDRKVA